MIPSNLFTGFLGVGKTTAVVELLRTKYEVERWAVLVNEYGEVGIDGALIEGAGTNGVSVREIAGGCICCAAAPELPVALHFLLTETKPDRLLIETTGLGHPARLIDTIRRNYADRIELRATIGLVAPGDVVCPGMFDNPIFMDQVHLADVLVLNKADTATPEMMERYTTWANGLFPPKLLIAATSQGKLDPAWLDLLPTHERFALHPEAHAATGDREQSLLQLPSRGKPVRYATEDHACGWVFSPADEFDEGQLTALLLGTAGVLRLKGVFQVDGECIAVQRTRDGSTVRSIAYRRDSRIEVFASADDFNWRELERALIACITTS